MTANEHVSFWNITLTIAHKRFFGEMQRSFFVYNELIKNKIMHARNRYHPYSFAHLIHLCITFTDGCQNMIFYICRLILGY